MEAVLEAQEASAEAAAESNETEEKEKLRDSMAAIFTEEAETETVS